MKAPDDAASRLALLRRAHVEAFMAGDTEAFANTGREMDAILRDGGFAPPRAYRTRGSFLDRNAKRKANSNGTKT